MSHDTKALAAELLAALSAGTAQVRWVGTPPDEYGPMGDHFFAVRCPDGTAWNMSGFFWCGGATPHYVDKMTVKSVGKSVRVLDEHDAMAVSHPSLHLLAPQR